MPEKCDLVELRRVAMTKAQAKVKRLTSAGVQVNGQTFSELLKASYAEARAECPPVDGTLTPEQMALLQKECPSCTKQFKTQK